MVDNSHRAADAPPASRGAQASPQEFTMTAATGEHQVSVGDDIVPTDTRWSFAGETAQVFDHHISKSVPLYREGHDLVLGLTEFFVRPGSIVIDVGCSTGRLIAKLARKSGMSQVSFAGFDVEADMVREARRYCADLDNVSIHQADARKVDYAGSSVVIMYYALQFVPKGERAPILRRVIDGLVPGGALMLFEKTLSPDALLQDIVNQLYADFKQAQGFDNDEIINKAKSLRSVLAAQPSSSTHALLREVGFTSIMTVQQYLCFEGMLAIK